VPTRVVRRALRALLPAPGEGRWPLDRPSSADRPMPAPTRFNSAITRATGTLRGWPPRRCTACQSTRSPRGPSGNSSRAASRS